MTFRRPSTAATTTVGTVVLVAVGLAAQDASNSAARSTRPPAHETIAAVRQAGAVVQRPAVEHPAALRAFAQAAIRYRRGGLAHVRVAHYGDSNIAAGFWTGQTKARLQSVLDDGGPGFLAVSPFGSRQSGNYRLLGINVEGRRHAAQGRYGPDDGLWGAAGVAVEARAPESAITLSWPADNQATASFWLLGQPAGGVAQLRAPGIDRLVDTARSAATPIVIPLSLPAAPREQRVLLGVKTVRPVRVLGVSVEKARGLVYDVFGINGQRAVALLRRDRALWAEMLRERQPHLVILSFGGNEALDPSFSPPHHRHQLEQTLARVRALMPEAACLLTAPVAMCDHANVRQVIADQRRIAASFGCAYWDTSAISGGPESLCPWRTYDLVSGDGLHLSPAGYEVVGDIFAEALLATIGQDAAAGTAD